MAKGTAFTFYISLPSQANTKIMQVNPTLAAGDVKYSDLTNAGALTNLATLPDVYPAGSQQVRVQISNTEANIEPLVIHFVDAAGSEWCSIDIIVYPSQIPPVDTPPNSAGVTTMVADYARRTGDYPTALQIDALLSASHGAGSWGGAGGSGSTAWTITIKDSGGIPIDGVEVWVTTDIAGVNVVASGSTDAFGVVTFMLDPGNYYAWKQLAGYTGTNPEAFAVP